MLVWALAKTLFLVGVDRLLQTRLRNTTLHLTVSMQITALTSVLATTRHLLVNLSKIIELSTTNPFRRLITSNQGILSFFINVVMQIIYRIRLLLLKLNAFVITSRSGTGCIMLR